MKIKNNNPEAITLNSGFGVIISICLLSLLFAGIFISVVNDVYAFVKPDTNVIISIEKGTAPKEFSNILLENGIIKNEFVFVCYLRSKDKHREVENIHGQWQLNQNMSYREILREFF